MKLLKLYETKKLFYKKYLYKLLIVNDLNTLFRGEFQKSENLSFAREKLDEFARNYRNGEPLKQLFFRTEREVTMEHYVDAKNLYLLLKNEFGNYKIRVETGRSITVYTNDELLLQNIAERLGNTVREIWKPAIGTHQLLEANSIIVNCEPEFPIRVFFKDERVPVDFANWLRANRDKSRIGDKALGCIDRKIHLGGFYFHVRDEKVLSIVHMLIGHGIREIYNLVYMPPTIDK